MAGVVFGLVGDSAKFWISAVCGLAGACRGTARGTDIPLVLWIAVWQEALRRLRECAWLHVLQTVHAAVACPNPRARRRPLPRRMHALSAPSLTTSMRGATCQARVWLLQHSTPT